MVDGRPLNIAGLKIEQASNRKVGDARARTLAAVASLALSLAAPLACVSDEGQQTEPVRAETNETDAADQAFAMKLVRAGHALAEQGDHEDALKAFDEALAIAPENALAHLEWGISAQMVGRPSEAVGAALQRAQSLAPENPRAQFQYALFRESQGDVEGAIEGYRTTLKLRQDHARARARLGALRLQQGDAKAALESLSQAVVLDPGPVPPRVSLAQAAEATGDVELAAKTLRTIVDEFPNVPIWRQRLIALYERHGDTKAAGRERKALEKVAPKEDRDLRPLKKKRRRRKRSRRR